MAEATRRSPISFPLVRGVSHSSQIHWQQASPTLPPRHSDLFQYYSHNETTKTTRKTKLQKPPNTLYLINTTSQATKIWLRIEFKFLTLFEKLMCATARRRYVLSIYCTAGCRYVSKKSFNAMYHAVASRVAEPEPEPVGTVFIWGLRHRNRNRIRNTVPVPGTRK
jgi:hypothetical protein